MGTKGSRKGRNHKPKVKKQVKVQKKKSGEKIQKEWAFLECR
jgi:hypothetical protein